MMRLLFRSVWIWPMLILLLTAAAGLVTFVPEVTALLDAGFLRPILVLAFLCVCPGMAVVRFFRLSEAIAEFILGLSLSFCIGALVAGIILYANIWSPTNIFLILLGFSVLGAILQLLLPLSRRLFAHRPSQPQGRVSAH
ncbi:MAG TPA: hypothetical protein VGT82_12000 [Ktedonobacteraceae bacterium]|nr:hypothetical protein [Ktedonobacteraceae bacterium]